MNAERFTYLATPYSKFPGGIESAFKIACKAAADLIRAGVRVYSPIAHTHPIAIHGGIDPYAHQIWLPADLPMMRAAASLTVLKAPGWESSYGIGEEIKEFRRWAKPVFWMEPGTVPLELVRWHDEGA